MDLSQENVSRFDLGKQWLTRCLSSHQYSRQAVYLLLGRECKQQAENPPLNKLQHGYDCHSAAEYAKDHCLSLPFDGDNEVLHTYSWVSVLCTDGCAGMPTAKWSSLIPTGRSVVEVLCLKPRAAAASADNSADEMSLMMTTPLDILQA